MVTTPRSATEPSATKLLVFLVIAAIVAVSIMQGAFLPGIFTATGVLVLYYLLGWVRQSEERSNRLDLVDQRVLELEKRIGQLEERKRQ